MNYQNTITDELKLYKELQAEYPGVFLAKDGSELVMDYHVITPSEPPVYDVYTQKITEVAPVNYIQTWLVVALTVPEVDGVDNNNRTIYENDMNRQMREDQMNSLGDPSGFRFLQGMSRVSHLVNKKDDGDTLNQEESDYIDGSKVGLEYQETNATAFAATVDEIALLSGGDIVSHAMPDFTMTPTTQTGYQPYLDYLEQGYAD